MGHTALVPVQPLQSNDEFSCISGFTCFPSTHDVGREIWINPRKVRRHTYVGLEWVEWKEGAGRRGKKQLCLNTSVGLKLTAVWVRKDKFSTSFRLLYWRALLGTTSKQGVWTTLTSGRAIFSQWCHVNWNSSCKTNVATFLSWIRLFQYPKGFC